MNLKSAGVAVVVLSCLCTGALAGDPRAASEAELRKDIAELQKSMAQLTSRLEAMEQRLTKLEKPTNDRTSVNRLIFPETVERAMLMDAWPENPRTFRGTEQRGPWELKGRVPPIRQEPPPTSPAH